MLQTRKSNDNDDDDDDYTKWWLLVGCEEVGGMLDIARATEMMLFGLAESVFCATVRFSVGSRDFLEPNG